MLMEQYWVEGLFVSRRGLMKIKRSGKLNNTDIEPFAKSYWANSPDEAIQFAVEELNGGEWTDGPRVSKTSEEQRMRTIGAPELPGLNLTVKKSRKR
jgi:hypothetical protein